MRRTRVAVWPAACVVLLGACSVGEEAAAPPTPAPTARSTPASPTASSTPSSSPAEPPSPPVSRRLPDDSRWLFFEDDETAYASPWWRGRARLQIAYGCTPAPYYVSDPRCDGTGFHHGYDFAIPCGTPLRAARPATVVSSAGLGPAYGENALLLRMTDDEGVARDVVIGHTRRNRVVEGDRIRRGERFAVVSDSAVYTGCHLHFEVRPAGGSVSQAVDPRPLLELRPRRDTL